jgi:SusD family.
LEFHLHSKKNNMKKILFLIVFSCTFILSSCKEDLLDIKNENTLSTGVFWKTESDVEDGLISVYGMFYRQGTWTRNIYTQMNGMADDGVSYAGWTELNEYAKFIFTNYDFGEVNTKIWKEHYVAIYRTNQVIDNIGKIEFKNEDHKNDIIGQAKFLCAFYYYYLTALWDNVPLVLATSSASDKPKGCSADEVFTQIEKDLEEAVLVLPETREPSEYGRATKGAAYGLLAKTYAQHHKWEDAKRCLEWIIDGNGKQYYSLVNNWGDNFSNKTEDNSESLYEIHFSLSNRVGFDQTDNPFDPNAQLGTQIEMNQAPLGIGWNNIEARRWLVDYYKREKTIDGKNDPRLYYTLWYDNAATDFPEFEDHKIYGKDWNPDWGSRVFIKKYSTDASPIYYWNDNNFRSIRLADMLLLYAEVINELNGPSQKAIECLNKVRNRVNLPNIDQSTFYNGSEICSSKENF